MAAVWPAENLNVPLIGTEPLSSFGPKFDINMENN
jgi:hypothetical protein